MPCGMIFIYISKSKNDFVIDCVRHYLLKHREWQFNIPGTIGTIIIIITFLNGSVISVVTFIANVALNVIFNVFTQFFTVDMYDDGSNSCWDDLIFVDYKCTIGKIAPIQVYPSVFCITSSFYPLHLISSDFLLCTVPAPPDRYIIFSKIV